MDALKPNIAVSSVMLASAKSPCGSFYQLVWRWHFYAGLFCLPFILWLSLTGLLYLFHPQIDGYLERSYNHVAATAPRRPVSEQVNAALTRIKKGRLNAYQIPASTTASAQILVGRGRQLYRVYVDPVTARVLHVVNDDHRFGRLLFHLHGELLLGDAGSVLVELAASWAVLMLLSGLYLWWPRGRSSLGGVIYPRWGYGSRVFLRDLHAVTGFWVSSLALLLIISGLPWAYVWGSMLTDARQWVSQQPVKIDWSTGRSSELEHRLAMNAPPHHQGASSMPAPSILASYRVLDRLTPVVSALDLPPPVLIAPPSAGSAHWTARSDNEDRPRRVNLRLDPKTGSILQRRDFSSAPLLDRLIGYGVAAHIGQLFGLANQLLGVFVTLGLILLSASAALQWWWRRPPGTLGAMVVDPATRYPWWGIAILLGLALSLPLLGLSMLLVWLLERYVLQRIPAARRILGLT